MHYFLQQNFLVLDNIGSGNPEPPPGGQAWIHAGLQKHSQAQAESNINLLPQHLRRQALVFCELHRG